MKINGPGRDIGQAGGATPPMLFSLVILTGLAAVGFPGAKPHSLPEAWPAEAEGGPPPEAFQARTVATPDVFAAEAAPIPEPLRAGRSRAPDTLWVAQFFRSPLEDPSDSGWLPLAFGGGRGETRYRPSARDGRSCLQAEAKGAGSGLIRPVTVQPEELPRLRWSWWVEGPVPGGDLTRKEGDDAAARVYVNFRFDPSRAGFLGRLKHRLAGRRFGGDAPGQSLVYVWAAGLPTETIIPNAYTDKAMMVVVRSGQAEAGRWWSEERNILEDFRRAFGEPPPDITSVAIMTDADDTGAEATACYGDIFFLPPGS
jgi:hypothetical protein